MTSSRCFSTLRQIDCSLCWACSWATARDEGNIERANEDGWDSKMNFMSSSLWELDENSWSHFSDSGGGNLVLMWGKSCAKRQVRFRKACSFSWLSRYFFLDWAGTMVVSLSKVAWILWKRIVWASSVIGSCQLIGMKASFSIGERSQVEPGGSPVATLPKKRNPYEAMVSPKAHKANGKSCVEASTTWNAVTAVFSS